MEVPGAPGCAYKGHNTACIQSITQETRNGKNQNVTQSTRFGQEGGSSASLERYHDSQTHAQDVPQAAFTSRAAAASPK